MIGRLKERIFGEALSANPLVWRLRSGTVVQVASIADWILYSEIFVDGEYDLPIRDAAARVPRDEPLMIVDLGANAGFFSLRIADLLAEGSNAERPARFLTVEGSPVNAAALRRRLAQNPKLAAQANVVAGLVGRRTGRAKMYEHLFHAANSIGNPILASHGRGVDVDFVDIDVLTAEMPTIHLLKCDIEGAEQTFIETYPDLLRRVQSAVFELHPTLCDAASCRSLLAEAGLTEITVLRIADDQSVEWFRRSPCALRDQARSASVGLSAR